MAAIGTLTFILLNIFSETTNLILMRFCRNVPATVPKNYLKKKKKKNDSLKNCGCHGNKT